MGCLLGLWKKTSALSILRRLITLVFAAWVPQFLIRPGLPLTISGRPARCDPFPWKFRGFPFPFSVALVVLFVKSCIVLHRRWWLRPVVGLAVVSIFRSDSCDVSFAAAENGPYGARRRRRPRGLSSPLRAVTSSQRQLRPRPAIPHVLRLSEQFSTRLRVSLPGASALC